MEEAAYSFVHFSVVQSQGKSIVNASKLISFKYTASDDLSSLFEDFRKMCNEAISIAAEERPKSRFRLIELSYERLKEYGLHSHYTLAACEVAFSLYRNKNRKSIPFIEKAFLKLDNQSYRLNHLLLRIPTTPRRFTYLVLEGSDYHAAFTDDPTLKRGSVTINEKLVNIAFTKEQEIFEPAGSIGIDVNERNVTVSATDGWHHRFDELSEVVELKEMYKDSRATIAQRTRGDRRTGRKLLAKYGRREKNRTVQRIHVVTKRIIEYAKDHKLMIRMEKLAGIRKLYRRGNGQGESYRGRMNVWVFGEIQRQTDYKARWEGVPCAYVSPRETSQNCPYCGSRVAPLPERKLYCAVCDKVWDRDDLASRNIMACAVPQARPSRGSNDGERGDDVSNPRSG